MSTLSLGMLGLDRVLQRLGSEDRRLDDGDIVWRSVAFGELLELLGQPGHGHGQKGARGDVL